MVLSLDPLKSQPFRQDLGRLGRWIVSVTHQGLIEVARLSREANQAQAKRRARGREEAANPWELVRLYEAPYQVVGLRARMGKSLHVWHALIPYRELMANLPRDCRWTPEDNLQRLVGAGIGAACGFFLVTLLSFAIFNLFVALVLGLCFGSMLGAVAGWQLAPRYITHPFWTVRRWRSTEIEQGTSEFEPGLESLPDEPGLLAEHPIVALTHSQLVPLRDTDPAALDARMQGGVFLATSMDHLAQAKSHRKWYSIKMNAWQKVQIGAYATLAGVMAVLLILLVLATTGDEVAAPAPAETTAAAEVAPATGGSP